MPFSASRVTVASARRSARSRVDDGWLRPAATTVTLSRVAVRRLKMFTDDLYAIRVTHGAAEFNTQVNDPWREDVRFYKSAERSARLRAARVVNAPDCREPACVTSPRPGGQILGRPKLADLDRVWA